MRIQTHVAFAAAVEAWRKFTDIEPDPDSRLSALRPDPRKIALKRPLSFTIQPSRFQAQYQGRRNRSELTVADLIFLIPAEPFGA